MSAHDKIIFTHIPKTAGTSFRKEVVEANCSRFYHHKGSLAKGIVRIIKSNPDVVAGHFAFGIHKFLFSKYRYLSFFREPVDRAISHYYFIRQSKYPTYEHPKWKDCMNYPIEEIYASRKLADNLQTRFISGIRSNRNVSSRDLYLAKKNLDEYYDVFGIQEYYSESVDIICKQYDWVKPKVDIGSREKKTNTKSPVSEAIREKLKHDHSFDLDLYNYALTKFRAFAHEAGIILHV